MQWFTNCCTLKQSWEETHASLHSCMFCFKALYNVHLCITKHLAKREVHFNMQLIKMCVKTVLYISFVQRWWLI